MPYRQHLVSDKKNNRIKKCLWIFHDWMIAVDTQSLFLKERDLTYFEFRDKVCLDHFVCRDCRKIRFVRDNSLADNSEYELMAVALYDQIYCS